MIPVRGTLRELNIEQHCCFVHTIVHNIRWSTCSRVSFLLLVSVDIFLSSENLIKAIIARVLQRFSVKVKLMVSCFEADKTVRTPSKNTFLKLWKKFSHLNSYLFFCYGERSPAVTNSLCFYSFWYLSTVRSPHTSIKCVFQFLHHSIYKILAPIRVSKISSCEQVALDRRCAPDLGRLLVFW